MIPVYVYKKQSFLSDFSEIVLCHFFSFLTVYGGDTHHVKKVSHTSDVG